MDDAFRIVQPILLQQAKTGQGHKPSHQASLQRAGYRAVLTGMMDYAVQEFIEGHAEWIFKKRKLVLSKDNRPDIVYLPEVTEESDRERIQTFIEEKVSHYASVMGVSYGRITMRNQKTRWGSCSSEGNLNFNCRLLFVPDRIVDYVVIHELAHRRFMNHSKAFWKEVEKYMPDYKEQKKLLSRFAIKH